MATPQYDFSLNRMYDVRQGVCIATKNPNDPKKQYIDKRGNVRASGLPSDGSIIRPQSSTGYAATPELPKGAGYQECCQPYRENAPFKKQYDRYKEAERDYAVVKDRYEKSRDHHQVDRALAVGGPPDQNIYYDQAGHLAMAPLAAAANKAGLRAATLRLEHTSDHYGRLPRTGHETHLQAAANLAGYGGNGSFVQKERFHGHYAKDPSTFDLPDDPPLAGLSSRERRKREKRPDIEWSKQINQWELSKAEFQAGEDERRANRARDKEYYESGQGMNHGPMLPNGKYQWIAVGGGRERFWCEITQDYVERRGERREHVERRGGPSDRQRRR